MNTKYSWVILLTLEYAVRVIFIPLDMLQLSPLENTEICTALIHHVHHVHGMLSWSSLVIIYMCKKVSEYPNHSFSYSPIYFPPPPDVIYYQRMSEILLSNYHFFNIT